MAWLRRQARLASSGQASLDDVVQRVCETFGLSSDAGSLPKLYVDVVFAAYGDYEPWWRDAFMETLRALDRSA